ncbi:MAG: ATP synthase F1 subunit delta [Firmicutes bacterium]|nr:ATP synthase F1 subunit delta [Bacillota bacterium]
MAELMTVDVTYGQALYSAARETGNRDQVLEDGLQLSDLLKTEPKLMEFLKDPGVSAAEKHDTIEKIFRGKMCDELINLLFVLTDRGRARNIFGIIRQYEKLAMEEDGIARGKVVSAAPLKEKQLKEIEEQTSKLLNMNVSLENEIDAGIIGGIKIFVDGRIMDASLRKGLEDLAGTLEI